MLGCKDEMEMTEKGLTGRMEIKTRTGRVTL